MMRTRYVNTLKTSLNIYSIRPNVSIFNIKMVEICTLQTVTSVLSKALS